MKRNQTTDQASEDTARRLPAIEIKILDVDRSARSAKLATRIASSEPGVGLPGGWSESTWMIKGDTLHLTFPKGFVWEPPVQFIELLYPDPEAVTA